MKKLLIILAVLMFAITCVGYGAYYEKEVPYVSYMSGEVDVEFRDNGGNSVKIKAARINMDLPVNSIVKTGYNSLCDITMPDGSTIKLASDTYFKLDSLELSLRERKQNAIFSLIRGQVKAKIGRLLNKDSGFCIMTNTVLAGVRGTVYGVNSKVDETDILVFKGEVEVSSTQGKFAPIVVRRGQMVTVYDFAPTEPKDISEETKEAWDEELKRPGLLGLGVVGGVFLLLLIIL